MKYVKKYEEFNWLDTATDLAGIIAPQVVFYLTSKLYTNSKYKKMIESDFDKTVRAGYTIIKGDNNGLSIFRNRTQKEPELVFALEPKTRKITYFCSSIDHKYDSIFPKKDFNTFYSRVNDLYNIQNSIESSFLELKDDFNINIKLRYANILQNEFFIEFYSDNSFIFNDIKDTFSHCLDRFSMDYGYNVEPISRPIEDDEDVYVYTTLIGGKMVEPQLIQYEIGHNSWYIPGIEEESTDSIKSFWVKFKK